MGDPVRAQGPVIDYYAQKAIRSILADFEDAWSLERIDDEWQDDGYFLRFHFKTEGGDFLIRRAQVDPATGAVLDIEALFDSIVDTIRRAPEGEIGNVAALKRYLPDPDDLKKMENYIFRDFEIVRTTGDYLRQEWFGGRFDHVTASSLVLVRRRISFHPLRRGQGTSTFVYDAHTGEVYLKGLGDFLEGHRDPPEN